MIRDVDKFLDWPPAGFDGLLAWEFLSGAFGPKIMPMDLDAVIERKGKLLVFEAKSPGAPIPDGQKITLTTLWKKYDATIFHIVGRQAGQVTGCAIYSAWENTEDIMVGERPLAKCNSYDVNYYAHRWFCKVEGTTPPAQDAYTRELWLAEHDVA